LGDLVSKNLKGNLRKARRKLAKCENAEFLSTREPSELPDFFADFLVVEASGWKGASGVGTAIVFHPYLTSFYRRLMHEFGARRQCEINLLKIDGRVAAGQFTLIIGNSMFLLKIGFSEEFSTLAPGNLLLAETLHRAKKGGEIEVVNLITDARWHASWRPTDHTVYECCCYARSARGFLAYTYRRLRSAVGAHYRAAREGTRRAINGKS
jgi:CelD/BcsL family acetyltransferase involved in cellulose biosynthesis